MGLGLYACTLFDRPLLTAPHCIEAVLAHLLNQTAKSICRWARWAVCARWCTPEPLYMRAGGTPQAADSAPLPLTPPATASRHRHPPACLPLLLQPPGDMADPQMLQTWFNSIDADRTGTISAQELQRALSLGGLSFSLMACAQVGVPVPLCLLLPGCCPLCHWLHRPIAPNTTPHPSTTPLPCSLPAPLPSHPALGTPLHSSLV